MGDRITALQQLVSPFGKVTSKFSSLDSNIIYQHTHIYINLIINQTKSPFLTLPFLFFIKKFTDRYSFRAL